MQDAAIEANSSTGPGYAWPTTTARVISALGLMGWILSIVLAAADYFDASNSSAILTMVILAFYTMAVPAARTESRLRSDKEQIADAKAAVFGVGTSFLLVLVTLLAAGWGAGHDQPVIVPAALLKSAMPILVAPLLVVPLLFRVWRKNPKR